MELLKKTFFWAFIFSSAWVHASGLMMTEVDPYKVLQEDQKKNEKRKSSEINSKEVGKIKVTEETDYSACSSSKEFQLTYEELKKEELLSLSERDNIFISYEVSKACDGAAHRFKKILQILIQSGVDKKKSIEIALHFAKKTDQKVEAFILVFRGTFLERYMDLDFKGALATSLNLALNVKGNPQNAAQDFREILDYCISNKGSGLPYKTCTPYALELSQYSHLYPSGMKKSFQELMTFFTQQKEIDYTLSRSLKLSAKVLRKGPKSVESFYEQFKYSVSDKMRLPTKAALELSVKVAENSYIEEK